MADINATCVTVGSAGPLYHVSELPLARLEQAERTATSGEEAEVWVKWPRAFTSNRQRGESGGAPLAVLLARLIARKAVAAQQERELH